MCVAVFVNIFVRVQLYLNIFKVSWEGVLQKRPQHQQDIVCVCVNIFLRICLRVRVFDLDIVCVAVFVKILSRPC